MSDNDNDLSFWHRPVTRRKAIAISGIAAAGAAVGCYDGFYREVRKAKVESLTIPLKNLGDHCRIAQLSDIHYGVPGVPCESLARQVNDQKPDAAVVTGDAISTLEGREQLAHLISLIDVPTYFIAGNWEHFLEWPLDERRDFYSRVGAGCIDNASTFLPHGGGVNLIGIDDPFTGRDDLGAAIKGIRQGKPRILLAHAPLIARVASEAGMDLTLCGHTHGGQIRLPFLGAVLVPPGSAGYDMGLYDVGGMPMYVNRGVGTCLLPIRFLCPAELTIIDLVPA